MSGTAVINVDIIACGPARETNIPYAAAMLKAGAMLDTDIGIRSSMCSTSLLSKCASLAILSMQLSN